MRAEPRHRDHFTRAPRSRSVVVHPKVLGGLVLQKWAVRSRRDDDFSVLTSGSPSVAAPRQAGATARTMLVSAATCAEMSIQLPLFAEPRKLVRNFRELGTQLTTECLEPFGAVHSYHEDLPVAFGF
jgi:hypothetical protein